MSEVMQLMRRLRSHEWMLPSTLPEYLKVCTTGGKPDTSGLWLENGSMCLHLERRHESHMPFMREKWVGTVFYQ